MKSLLAWWYSVALPQLPVETPKQREKSRYAHLTAGFLLLISALFMPAAPFMIFFSPQSPSSPPIAFAVIFILVSSFVFGRMGHNILSASCIVLYNLVIVTCVMATNPLDPSLLPLFGVFTIAIILAGALMPPVAALVVGFVCCVDIGLISMFVGHTAAYEKMIQDGLYTITLFLPIVIQILIAVIIFIIMRSLLQTIRRADRAEEIVALQVELAASQRKQAEEQRQLEEGFRRIADVHARVANGDLNARVSFEEGNVLWSVAVPLNNLLNRMQRTKNDTAMLLATQQAAMHVAQQLHEMFISGQPVGLSPTGTALDPVILEINKTIGQLPSRGHSKSREFNPVRFVRGE